MGIVGQPHSMWANHPARQGTRAGQWIFSKSDLVKQLTVTDIEMLNRSDYVKPFVVKSRHAVAQPQPLRIVQEFKQA